MVQNYFKFKRLAGKFPDYQHVLYLLFFTENTLVTCIIFYVYARHLPSLLFYIQKCAHVYGRCFPSSPA